MLKTKYFIMTLLLIFIMFLIPTMVKAEDAFSTNDGIVAKKVVNSMGGDIELIFSNIALNEEFNYTWAIGRNTNVSEVEKWYSLGDFSQSNKTAKITLTVDDTKILKVLRETNTAWIYIKDNTNDTLIVDALKVDLTLPVLKAFEITENQKSNTFRSFNIKSIYKIDNLYYNIQKITDKQVIENYKNAKINGKSLESVSGLATIGDAPQDGWNVVDEKYTVLNEFYIHKKPTEPGIYYVWIKAKDVDSKMVYGYSVFGLDNIAPTVSNIKVVSPVSGTYKTPQTVTIRVNFNETITGTSVPTLKIKFGDSAERSLTNGTIKDNYIEYTYNIQDSDNGQLVTVSLSGGTIKDAYNNDAKLSCPIISGYTIKANIEGAITNNTENQDKTNNNKSNNESTKNGGTSNNNTNNNGNSKSSDSTIAPGKIPYTGGATFIIISLIGIVAVGIYVYKRNNDLKGI